MARSFSLDRMMSMITSPEDAMHFIEAADRNGMSIPDEVLPALISPWSRSFWAIARRMAIEGVGSEGPNNKFRRQFMALNVPRMAETDTGRNVLLLAARSIRHLSRNTPPSMKRAVSLLAKYGRMALQQTDKDFAAEFARAMLTAGIGEQ